MTHYTFCRPPVRTWPRLWLANMRYLLNITHLGPLWRDMRELRTHPPMDS